LRLVPLEYDHVIYTPPYIGSVVAMTEKLLTPGAAAEWL